MKAKRMSNHFNYNQSQKGRKTGKINHKTNNSLHKGNNYSNNTKKKLKNTELYSSMN